MKPVKAPLFPVSAIRLNLNLPPVLAVAAILTLGSGSLHAALTWNSAGPTDNWSTAAANPNWNPGGVVWTQNESAVFDASSGAAEAIAVTTDNTFDNLTFDVTGFSITSAGAGSFLLANDLASTITVTNLADSAIVSETIANNAAGASTLTKAGLGTLTLSPTATSTFSGGTLVSAGTLVSTITPTINALGTGPVSISGGTTLNLNNTNTVNSTPIISNVITGSGLLKLTFAAGATARNTNLPNVTGFTGTIQLSNTGATGDKWNAANLGTVNAALIIDSGSQFFPNGTTAATFPNGITLTGTGNSENRGAIRLNGPLNANLTLAGSATIGTEGGLLTGNITSGAAGTQTLTLGTANSTGGGTIGGIIGGGTGTIALSAARGTFTLSGANTYTGKTSVGAAGAAQVNVATLNSVNGGVPVLASSSLGAPTTVADGTIDLGSGNNAGALSYLGTGETTDRVINLASTFGTVTLNQSGTGPLKFTSDLTATGVGAKTLVLNGSTAGSGEIAGIIGNLFNNGVTLATTASAAFAAAATSITVASVTNVSLGAVVSGTGITGGQKVASITGAGPFTIGLTAGANAAGTLNQAITFTAPNALSKDGTGSWTLSGNNSFVGNININAGPIVITNSNALGTGTKALGLTNGTAGNPSLRLDGSAGPIDLPATFTYSVSNQTGDGCLVNLAGNNTVAGQFNITSGGGGMMASSLGGDLNITANITAVQTGRALFLTGTATGTVSGIISNGTTAGLPVQKDGTGTWTLTGANTYTGNTIVNAGTFILGGAPTNATTRVVNGGTMVISGDYSLAGGGTTTNGGLLRLDYSTFDDSKLSDSYVLTLGGGTVELAGGSHAEGVSSTTVAAGKSTLITRSSGSATLNLRAVTSTGAGSVVLAEPGIATTDSLNVNGILPWARVLVGGVPTLATNSTDAAEGPIVPYTGFTDITRLGPVSVPNGIANNVRIINGGTAGNITVTGAPLNQINFLQMAASEGPATIVPTSPTDVFMIGDETGGTLWQTATAGALTIGTTANDGVLTTGNTDNLTPATLSLLNESPTSPLTINSAITDNATDAVSLALAGPGSIALTGNNTITGAITLANVTATLSGSNNTVSGITVNSSTLTLSGNNSFASALTINNGGKATLTGDNSGRPFAVAGRTVVNSGGTLQLQANAGNTVAGISFVLGPENTSTLQPLHLFNGGLIQLRSDASVTFAGGNLMGGLNNATLGLDVDRLDSVTTGQKLTLAPDSLPFGNAVTFNITGANGYSLGLGTFRNVTGTASALTLNPTTANLVIAGYSNQQTTASASTLILGGTALANEVTGPIANQSPTTPTGTGIVNVTKSGTGTWTLSGANTYTGTTTISGGMLKLNNATALTTGGALSMSGTGVLDLNGFNATCTNVAASAITNTITDSSAVGGTSTLSISAQATTVSALVKDGPARALRVLLKSNNSGAVPFAVTNANTFSGGLVLQHFGTTTTTGTRLRISAALATVGVPGALISGPFGTGAIFIGETATDKAGMLLDTVANLTIPYAIVFNTILGTDQPGIRLDTTGHVFSGTITANLSNALFGNTGAATLTGQITGPSGLQLTATAVTITLANATANPNNYVGDTTIGTNAKLLLGANNQVPDGATAGNVTNNGTLNVTSFSDTINGLTGTGVVTGSGGTLSVGGNNASATYSGSTGGALALTKVGSGFQTLTGVIGHTGDTTVSQGTLAITVASTFGDSADIRLTTGASLFLSAAGTDVIDQLFINNVPQAAGKWGRLGSIAALGANHETALISGDGLLQVTTAGGTPFSLWAAANGLDGSPGKEAGPTDDPDHDGKSNLAEFGFDGNPLSGANDGKIVGKIATVGAGKAMTLTLPVRTGATFSGAAEQVSAAIDGVIYRIQGGDTLAAPWSLAIAEVTGADATAIQAGLPALSTGWTYRTFRSPGTVTDGDPSDFLRAGVE